MIDFVEENDIEATALSLKALTRLRSDSPVLSRAARWLVSNRTRGFYWNSTKDTAFGIFGLIDFVRANKELSPDYQLEVYLNGEAVILDHVTSATQPLVINRGGSTIPDTNVVKIVKRGRGALYFAGSLNYYTTDEQVTPRGTSQLSITREYLRLRIVEDVNFKLK